MSLEKKLDSLKQRVEGNIPPRFLKVMHGSIKELKTSGIQEQVLKSGNQLPDFELNNQKGKLISSKELLKKGPLVVIFYRGFWCSYCNADLSFINSYVEEINDLGANVIAVSPERPEYSLKITLMHKLRFDILWDESNNVAAQFGIKYILPEDLKELYRESFHINLKLYHGDDEWALPMPGRFLADTDGTVKYAESSADYRKRPDPKEFMSVLKTLK